MSKDIRGKYELELNFPGDGRVFLNFWDYAHGNDVVAEMKEGKLFLVNDGQGKEVETSFEQFCEKVKQSITDRKI